VVARSVNHHTSRFKGGDIGGSRSHRNQYRKGARVQTQLDGGLNGNGQHHHGSRLVGHGLGKQHGKQEKAPEQHQRFNGGFRAKPHNALFGGQYPGNDEGNHDTDANQHQPGTHRLRKGQWRWL